MIPVSTARTVTSARMCGITCNAPYAMIQRVLLCGHTGGAQEHTLPPRAVAHVEFPPSRHGDSTMAGSGAVGLLMSWPHGRNGDVHWETNDFGYDQRLGPTTQLATSYSDALPCTPYERSASSPTDDAAIRLLRTTG